MKNNNKKQFNNVTIIKQKALDRIEALLREDFEKIDTNSEFKEKLASQLEERAEYLNSNQNNSMEQSRKKNWVKSLLSHQFLTGTLIGSFVMAIFVAAYFFAFNQPLNMEDAGLSEDTQLENKEKRTDQTITGETEILYSYNTYKDDYITFKYPEDYAITVKSGKISDPPASNFQGVQSIKINNLIETDIIYSGGLTKLKYDPSDPKNISIRKHTDDLKTYSIIQSFNKNLDNGLYLTYIKSTDSENKTMQYTYLSEKKNALLTGYLEIIPRDYAKFLYITQGSYLGYTPSDIDDTNPRTNITCNITDQSTFETCYNNLNVFFNSVKTQKSLNNSITEENNKQEDPYKDWVTCKYEDSENTISFKIKNEWECVKSDDSIPTPSTLIKSERLEFKVGFLFEAGCQNIDSSCDIETIYENSEIKISKIFNENPDGSKYVNSFGHFPKVKNNSIGIRIISPNLKNRALTKKELEELKMIMDSIEIK